MKQDIIHCGDCLEWLRSLPDGCADLILTDPPYGTTKNGWDKAPDWGVLFGELWRVVKPDAAILVFSQNPVAADIITSQRKLFRYEWVWVKSAPAGFANAKKMPMRKHELVLVFYRRLPYYAAMPIAGQDGEAYVTVRKGDRSGGNYGNFDRGCVGTSDGSRYPQDVVEFDIPAHDGVHPTRKPQGLCEMLIGQYTRPGEVVLDPYLGSGTTAAAAKAAGRHFLGCELDAGYHAHAVQRVAGVTPPLPGMEQGGMLERKAERENRQGKFDL